jgi:hypothetical protein
MRVGLTAEKLEKQWVDSTVDSWVAWKGKQKENPKVDLTVALKVQM